MMRLLSRKNTIIAGAITAVLIVPLFVLALFSHPATKTTTTPATTNNGSSGTTSSNSNSSTGSGTSGSTSTSLAVPTNDEILQTVAQQSPASEDSPGTTTVNATTDLGSGWFSANLQRSSDSENEQLLLKQRADGSLQLVEGPGTAFAKSVLDADNVPLAVQEQLLVYNDE